MKNGKNKRTLISLLVIGYAGSRFALIQSQGLFNDEAIYCHWAMRMNTDPSSWFLSMKDGKFPVIIWLMRFFQAFFRNPVFASRLMNIGFGVLCLIGLMVLTEKLFDFPAAVLSGIMFLFFPFSLLHDTRALFDAPLNAFSAWGLVLILIIFRDQKEDVASLSILAMIGAFAYMTKLTGIQTLLFIIIGAMLYKRRAPLNRNLRILALPLLMIALAHVILHRASQGFGMAPKTFPKLGRFFAFPGGNVIEYFRFARQNAITIGGYMSLYFGWGAILASVLGIQRLFKEQKGRDALLIILWFSAPVLFYISFSMFIFSRYLLPCSTPLLALAAGGVMRLFIILGKRAAFASGNPVQSVLVKMIIFIILFFTPIRFTIYYVHDQTNAPMAPQDIHQYVSGWPAGNYFPELIRTLEARIKSGRVNLITGGHLGLIPDGLPLYIPKTGNCAYASVDAWGKRSLQKAYDPDRENIIILDEFCSENQKVYSDIMRENPELELLAEFSNPGHSGSKCWALVYP